MYFIAVHSFCLGALNGAQPRPGVIPEDFEGPLTSGLLSGSFHCTWCCGGLLLGDCINLLNPVVENNGIAARLGGASKKINESFKAEDSGGNQPQQGQSQFATIWREAQSPFRNLLLMCYYFICLFNRFKSYALQLMCR